MMVDTYALEEKLEGFNKEQRYLLMSNVSRMQLNSHCSIGCPDCGLGAEPMRQNGLPREGYAMPWDLFTKLVDELGKMGGRVVNLYWRSEPFDYSSQGKCFLDAYEYLTQNVHLAAPLYVQTAVPSGSEEQILRSLDIIGEIDITHHKKRLASFIDTIVKQHPDKIPIFSEGHRSRLGPRNIGNLSSEPVSCDNGVLLTPLGIYSIHTTVPSRDLPYGYDLWEVTPEDFRIAAVSCSPAIFMNNFPHNVVAHFNERWLHEGFHEVHSYDDALLLGFQRYFMVRFSMLAGMEAEPDHWRPIIKHMLTNSEKLEKEMPRPFHKLEKTLIDEMKRLVN